jgi:hypothetical protein
LIPRNHNRPNRKEGRFETIKIPSSQADALSLPILGKLGKDKSSKKIAYSEPEFKFSGLSFGHKIIKNGPLLAEIHHFSFSPVVMVPNHQ